MKMDIITFGQVDKHVKKIKPELDSQLNFLEILCIEGRDREDNPIPLYLTKWRTKKSESVYLKTKRQNITLDQITDYGGLRLLCLFEKDIFPIHEFFLNIVKEKHYKVIECKIYNWGNEHCNPLTKPVEMAFPDCDCAMKSKKSGYKSIHYIVQRDGSYLPLEIQLRTLVQDVWGELEHSLSYKRGSVHPHIRKSFFLLSKDLENIDNLLTHLREISEKEQCGDRYSNMRIGPKHYFFYEPGLFPKCFQEEGKLQKMYEEYNRIIETERTPNIKDAWVPQACESLQEFDKVVTKAQLRKDNNLDYWLRMEKAYLTFCRTEYEESRNLYKAIEEDFPGRYCVQFRLGELDILLGNVERALTFFDEAERLLIEEPIIDHLNHYRIKLRLALTYWTLGEEYIDISIKEIEEAEEIFSAHPEINEDKHNQNVLANNICWYNMEKYIIAEKFGDPEADKLFDKVEEKFADVKKLLDSDEVSRNSLDTVAWFYFNKYKRRGDLGDLDLAKHYCHIMGDKSIVTSFNFRSINLHINHIQEIMNA